MTATRFVGSSGGVYDRYNGDRFTWSEWEEIIRIMNNLNEKARERSKALSKLQKENEQLKNNIREVKTYNNWLVAVLEDAGAIIEIKKGDVE